MPIVPVENLGAVGIVLDVPPHELPPEAWSNGENVRFFEGKVQKMPGHKAVFGAPPVAPHSLLYWKTLTEDRWIYPSTGKVYYTYNDQHFDITRYNTTPGDNDYNAGVRPLWTGGNLHGVPILNHDNRTDYPQQWDVTLGRLKDLDNWPANTYAKIIRPFQNFLIALDITKNGNRFPYTVKWSHPADPGTVPISWDEADPSKLAGEQTIAQSGGFLVDCYPLGGNNIIYKQDSIWNMSLSNSQFVFGFRELSSTIGALAPRCIQEFFRQHLVVGQNDIILFDGVNLKSVVNRRVRNWFFDALHSAYWDKTVVTVHYAKREVWICFVETGATSEYLTRALIWNWDTNTWSTRALPDIAHIAYGLVSSGGAETFDGVSGSIDTDFGQIDTSGVSPTALQLLMARAYGTPELIQGDTTYQFDGVNYTSYVERTGLAIAGQDRQGNLKVDPASIKFIRTVFPKITAPAETTVRISVGMQESLDGAVRWDGPHDFIVGRDTKIDVALSGRYLAFRLEDNSSVPWEFTGYKLDMDVISEY